MMLYEDVDGDGLGDPDTGVLGCTAIGYVSDSTDSCPLVFGTIGSPCDDGLLSTINDALDGTCACVGEFSTGMDPGTQPTSGFAMWPNPNSGGPWTVVSGDLGQEIRTATFELLDMLGNRVLTRVLKIDGRSVKAIIAPAAPPAAGLYLARLQAGRRSFVQRVVVN